jgi:hypothetical protein
MVLNECKIIQKKKEIPLNQNGYCQLKPAYLLDYKTEFIMQYQNN